MRIAFLTPYLPYPPDTGGKNRTYNLLKRLGRGHQVDLYVPVYGPDSRVLGDLNEFCANIWIYVHQITWGRRQFIRDRLTFTPATVLNFSRPGTVTEMRRDLAKRDYDLVFVDEIVMAPYAWELDATPRLLARHKADSLYFWDVALRCPWGRSKLWHFREAMLLRIYESKVWSVYRHGIVVSEKERDLLLGVRGNLDLCVAPNGVDLGFFSFKAASETEVPVILCYGTMSYYPNVDAVLYFFGEVYPLIKKRVPAFRVMVVGQDRGPEISSLENEYNNVMVIGTVPDVRPYLEESTLVVVPVRIGGGTRLKIPEAMAAGRPVVSTSIGCEGLGVTDGRHLLMADSPSVFADKVVALIEDASLRRHLARNGRSLVEESFSWDSVCARVERFCRKVVASENRVAD